MRISILGLYYYDNTIFENFTIPENLDKELLVNNLLSQCAELEILFPSPDYFKVDIEFWSRRRLTVWTELEATLHYEYNPIENYNRTDTFTENITEAGTQKNTYTEDSNKTGTVENTINSTSTTDSTALNKHYRNGFNGSGTSSGYGVLAETDDNAGKVSYTGGDTGKTADSETRKNDFNGTITDDRQTDKTNTGRSRGNIGVTTTQAMITAQREVVSFDIYQYIIDDFKQQYCLLIY